MAEKVANVFPPVAMVAAGVVILAYGWSDWVGLAALGAGFGFAVAHVSGAR
jgi:hypothetical protein